MSETPQSKAAKMMAEIEAASRNNYSKGEVKTMLNVLAQMPSPGVIPVNADESCRAPVKVDDLRRGDVFIAKLVGGKVRPWVVLRVIGGNVSAVAMSSGEKAPGLVPSQCRFWPSSWIGSTISMFDMAFATAEVTRPYTNLAHLAEIEAHICEVHGLGVPPPKVQSLAEIRTRMKA